MSAAPELHSAIVDHLSKETRARIGGEFSVELHAGPRELAEAAEPAQRALEEREEVTTIERLREADTSGAAWGDSPTLQALREGRVMLLAVDDMYARPGARCGNCGGLWAFAPPRCPTCGSEVIETVEDVVELAIEQALEQRAAIEIVRSDSARQLMADRGRIAAQLRW